MKPLLVSTSHPTNALLRVAQQSENFSVSLFLHVRAPVRRLFARHRVTMSSTTASSFLLGECSLRPSSTNSLNRIIALVDMDCFYVAVEQKLNPELKGKPTAVVQYQAWRGGGIIAVSYEARAFGVTRNMRGDDAKEVCPDIHLCRVQESRGKANLTKYRDASAEVMTVMKRFSDFIERASIDEAYIDLTAAVDARIKDGLSVSPSQLPNTFVAGFGGEDIPKDVKPKDREERRLESVRRWLLETSGCSSDFRLSVGAALVEEMRTAVAAETTFNCSAGISHSKMFAKYACGMNKPNRQTVLPVDAGRRVLFPRLPLKNLRNLGGKLGQTLEDLGCVFVTDLTRFTRPQLVDKFGERVGLWLHSVGQGFDNEPVTPRSIPKSIGCSKNFRGPQALDTKEKVRHWLGELSAEVVERLEKDKETNNRVAKLCTASISGGGGRVSAAKFHASRVFPISLYKVEKIVHDAFNVLSKLNEATSNSPQWIPPVVNLGLSASKFEDTLGGSVGGGGGGGGGSASIKDLLLRAAASNSVNMTNGSRRDSIFVNGEEEEEEYHGGVTGGEDADAIAALTTLIEEDAGSDDDDDDDDGEGLIGSRDGYGENDADNGRDDNGGVGQDQANGRSFEKGGILEGGEEEEEEEEGEDDEDEIRDDIEEEEEEEEEKQKQLSEGGDESKKHVGQEESLLTSNLSLAHSSAHSPPPSSLTSAPRSSSSSSPSSTPFVGVVRRWRKAEDKKQLAQSCSSLRRFVAEDDAASARRGKLFFRGYFEENFPSEREAGGTMEGVVDAGVDERTDDSVKRAGKSSTNCAFGGRADAVRVSSNPTNRSPTSPIRPSTSAPSVASTAVDEAFYSQIDLEVVDELPPELQREIREAMNRRQIEKKEKSKRTPSKLQPQRRRQRSSSTTESIKGELADQSLDVPASDGANRPSESSNASTSIVASAKRKIDDVGFSASDGAALADAAGDSPPLPHHPPTHTPVATESYLPGPAPGDLKSASASHNLERLVRCDVCDEMVDVLEADEHKDFHFAAELQKEIRKNDVLERRAQRQVTTTLTTTSKTNSPSKRGGKAAATAATTTRGRGRGGGRGRGRKEFDPGGSRDIKNFFS